MTDKSGQARPSWEISDECPGGRATPRGGPEAGDLWSTQGLHTDLRPRAQLQSAGPGRTLALLLAQVHLVLAPVGDFDVRDDVGVSLVPLRHFPTDCFVPRPEIGIEPVR